MGQVIELATGRVLRGDGAPREQDAPAVPRRVEHVPAEGRDFVDGQVNVRLGEREFAVIDGRRWTRVPEYLSNGQLTARFFVDEKTGEAREADGWKKPKRWPMPADATRFALAIVEAARG